MNIIQILAKEFDISKTYIENIIELIDEGSTIPFIARYRKEKTGACDDQVLQSLNERLLYLRNLQKRKDEVKEAITALEKMTEEISLFLENAKTLSEVEDIYRPYKQKRRTKATIAKEKGLQPLADVVFEQKADTVTLEEIAAPFLNENVKKWEDALSGAKDIICETISDDANLRKLLREHIYKEGSICCVGDAQKPSVYEMYYDYCEKINKIPSHRVLAINRGEKEEFLKVDITLEEELIFKMLNKKYVRQSVTSACVDEAAINAYKNYIKPSIHREIRSELTLKAAEQAINMFAANLKPLLLQPPIKNKVTMGFDPAYRTGCKIAVVDGIGKLLDFTVVYPTPPQNKIEEAKKVLSDLIKKHNVSNIAIGNGTASGESEIFIADLIKDFKLTYMMVNEAGASVYSASALGAKEFPNLDVSIRSAVSIARRLQDPLSELVKIDPKSIGVGLYQHDMPPAKLDTALNYVVESCVNSVGVNLNTASAALLTYVSGLNATVAQNIVAYREENGAFTARTQLKKVARLGGKAYEQCAGFLRIIQGKNTLDNTSVHPESYAAAKKLLAFFNLNLNKSEDMEKLSDFVAKMGEENVAKECEVGILTLKDIISELKKPGRDIRDELPPPLLRSGVLDIANLKNGMKLKGTVRNVVDFGVFVDIGVHQDGLVHISQITDKFIKHPGEVLSVGDIVDVTVLSLDEGKKRISLSMKEQ